MLIAMISFIVHNLFVALFLSIIWMASFFIDEAWSNVSFFYYMAILVLVLSPLCFAIVNRKLAKSLNKFSRIFLIAFLCIIFSILWYTTINIITPILCGIFSIPILNYFKTIEPITQFLSNIDDNKIIGLIFLAFWILIVTGYWYWVCFKGGARKWSDEIINFWGKFAYKPIAKPKSLKIFITIFLIFSWFGVCAVIMSLR